MNNTKIEQTKKIKVRIPNDIAKGVYSNIANVSASRNEVIIDFVLHAPPTDATLVSRVIMSPEHCQAFIKVLDNVISKYKKE